LLVVTDAFAYMLDGNDGQTIWRSPVIGLTGELSTPYPSIFPFDDITDDMYPDIVVNARFWLVVLDGKTGNLIWRFMQPSRSNADAVLVSDIDSDGARELAVLIEEYRLLVCLSGKGDEGRFNPVIVYASTNRLSYGPGTLVEGSVKIKNYLGTGVSLNLTFSNLIERNFGPLYLRSNEEKTFTFDLGVIPLNLRSSIHYPLNVFLITISDSVSGWMYDIDTLGPLFEIVDFNDGCPSFKVYDESFTYKVVGNSLELSLQYDNELRVALSFEVFLTGPTTYYEEIEIKPFTSGEVNKLFDNLPDGEYHFRWCISYFSNSIAGSWWIGPVLIPSSLTRANPTVTLSPDVQAGVTGSTLSYTVSLTNNDPQGVGTSTFSLSYSVPSGWSASLSKTSVTLNPGETDSSIILSVTSPTTASTGDYTVSVTAKNVEAPNCQGTAYAFYRITHAFNIDILRTQFFSKIKGKIVDVKFSGITLENSNCIIVTLEITNLRAAIYTIDVYNGPIYTYQKTVFLEENGETQLVHSIQQYDNVPGFYLKLDVNVGVHVYLVQQIFDNILGFSPPQDTLWQITKAVKDKYFPEKPFLDLYDFPSGWKSWVSAIANYMKENPEVFVQIAAEYGVSYTVNKILEKASLVLSAISSILNSVDLIIKALTCPAEETLHIVINSVTQATSVGSALVLQESTHKLYLHVYDSENRHVGINQQTKEIDLEIPGTTYFDYGGRIIIILPNSTAKFKLIVDATSAKETLETYNLTIATFKNGDVVDQQQVINASIKQNEKVEYQIDISSNGKLSVTPLAPKPLQLYLYAGVFVILSLMVGIIYVIKVRKKSHSTPQPLIFKF